MLTTVLLFFVFVRLLIAVRLLYVAYVDILYLRWYFMPASGCWLLLHLTVPELVRLPAIVRVVRRPRRRLPRTIASVGHSYVQEHIHTYLSSIFSITVIPSWGCSGFGLLHRITRSFHLWVHLCPAYVYVNVLLQSAIL